MPQAKIILHIFILLSIILCIYNCSDDNSYNGPSDNCPTGKVPAYNDESKCCPSAAPYWCSSLNMCLAYEYYRVDCDIVSTSDSTIPRISITSPLNESCYYYNTINISGTASDDNVLDKINIYIDGIPLAEISGTTNWTVLSPILNDGEHIISALAYDNAKKQSFPATAKIDIKTNTVRSVSILEPASGTNYCGRNVMLYGAFSIEACCNDKSIEYQIDASNWTTVSNYQNGLTGHWTHNFEDISASGEHSINVRISDGCGTSSTKTNTFIYVRDCWLPISSVDEPSQRSVYACAWSGEVVAVWGGNTVSGSTNTGSMYNPNSNTWQEINTRGAPLPKYDSFNNLFCSYLNNYLFLWGGGSNDGSKFNKTINSWSQISSNINLLNISRSILINTENEIIIWGGYNGTTSTSSGWRYEFNNDEWELTSLTGCPSARYAHSAIWTGSEMIIWGGNSGSVLNTGGIYNPQTDTWISTTTINSPSSRYWHSAIWTGSEMIVWGGVGGGSLNDGKKYNLLLNIWNNMSSISAPSGRYFYKNSITWTGQEMVVWGGITSNTGGRYNPTSDSWQPMSVISSPSVAGEYYTFWTGKEVLAFCYNNNQSCGRYYP